MIDISSLVDILGAGGGGGKGGGAGSYNEAPNTLRTISTLYLLFLLSNGEIKGFPPGQDIRKFIYINEIPIISPDGTVNYKGVAADFRSGTAIQDAITGASGFTTGNTISVQARIFKGNGPIIRFINAPGADAIRVSLYTPSLLTIKDDGSAGARVDFRIELSVNGGPWVTKVQSYIDGKTSGGFSRDYTIRVIGNGPWQVRVTRLTADSLTDRLSNQLYWQSVSPLFTDRLIYPNRAMLFLGVDAAYFTGQIRLAIKLSGIICSIPSNYNPITRVYTGIWDGLFIRAATSNPAWIIRECLVQNRWGLGRHVRTDQVDKWSFYRFAQYCDESVSNGWGGTEPRFEYKSYVRTAGEAVPTLNNIMAQCRANFHWNGSQVMIVQDRPGIVPNDPYTQANVRHEFAEDGAMTQAPFNYQPAALQSMHTIVLVKFSDPDNFGKDAVARVTCADIGYPQDLTQYGERVLEVTLPGCCSRGAATRHGRWVLITERLEDVTVAFGVGQEGLLKELGTLIAVQDEDDWDINVGGRILAVAGNTITLDRPITAPVGSELMVGANGQMVTYQISGTANNAQTITVIGSATAASMENVWLLSTPTVKPTLWRLLSSSESDNSYGMQALKHDPAKYAIADNIGSFQQANSPAYANPLPPTNIEVTGSGDSSYLIGWSPSPTRQVAAYILQKQIKDSNIWQTIPVAPGYTDAEITTSPNIYRFRVASISFLNRQSDWLVSNYYGSFTGRIVSANPDGTVTLDRDVVLAAGKAYQIETIVHGIKDLRPIINAAGTYRVITTNPGYAGASAFFEWGNPATLPPAIDNKASAIRVVGSGIATAYSQQNFTGASQVFTEGLYLASRGGLSAVGNNAISSLQVAQNTTAYLYEGEPGENPQPASIWRLIEL